MKVGSCPDDSMIESYFYNDLPFRSTFLLRLHLTFCRDCRKRLGLVKDFHKILSETSICEPPEGFLEDLLAAVQSWERPSLPVPSYDGPVVGAPLSRTEDSPAVKIRWALGMAAFAVVSVLQWRLGDNLPELMRGRYLLSFSDIQSVWTFLSSGQWISSMKSVIDAIRADGLASLIILGSTIPWLLAGVLICGGVVTVMFIQGLRHRESGGDG
ncbi:MAG: hypothetical protein ACOX3V_01000 [Bacillota bacterium]|jgi:hypothetical protein